MDFSGMEVLASDWHIRIPAWARAGKSHIRGKHSGRKGDRECINLQRTV